VQHPKSTRLKAGYYNDRPKLPPKESICYYKSRDPEGPRLWGVGAAVSGASKKQSEY